MKYAKPVIKDKFWIVKDDNINIATIEKRDNSFVVIENNVKVVFDSESEIEKHFKEDVFKNVPKNLEINKKKSDIDGYPTKTVPFNIEWFDSIPTYTKTEKSQDRYCAGYYGVRFEGGTFLGNNPKLVTITEKCLDFVGPFKTEMEANINISTKKKQVKQGIV